MVPLALAGAIYVILLIGYTLYSLYAFHHLGEFGYSNDTSSHMVRVYVVLSMLIVAVTIGIVVIGLVSR